VSDQLATGWTAGLTDRARTEWTRLSRDYRASRVWRTVISPGSVVALAYVPILSLYAWWSRYTRASDFLTIGVPHGTAAGVGYLALGRSTYDAQFAYFMARFPGWNGPHVYDDAVIRWSRMLQPLLVRIISGGNIDLMPWAFLVINVVSAAVGTAILGHLLVSRGQSRWLALAYGLYAGIQVAIFRDVADPLAILWLIVAIWGLQRQSLLQTAAALGFALLTRESLLLFVPLFLLPLAIKRRWALVLVSAAVSLVPFAIWQVALRLWLGKWGFIESQQANRFAHYPFAGMIHSYLAPQFGLIVIFAAVPTVLIWIVAASEVYERGWMATLLEPIALAALIYTVLLSFQNLDHWRDLWASGRLLAPAVPFVLLLHPRAFPQVRSALVTTLLLSAFIVTFNVMWG
jgi:hypothetical protein